MVEYILSMVRVPSAALERDRERRGREVVCVAGRGSGRQPGIVSVRFMLPKQMMKLIREATSSLTNTLVLHKLKPGPQLWLLALDSFSDPKARSCLS